MIRKALEADIPQVAAIYEAILADEAAHPGAKSRTGWLPGVYPVAETAQAALARGDLYVAEETGQVLASAIINHQQTPAYADGQWRTPARDTEVLVLHTLVVHPTAGSRGLGRAFLTFYEAEAARLHCRALRLDTQVCNRRARNFYLRHGYTEAGIVPCEFNGIPDVRLVLLEKPCV